MSRAGRASPAFAVPRSLYVHVPICSAKCRYCDFYSLPAASFNGTELRSLVLATLERIEALS
ncbi:MAG TPA: hypothetical protein VMC79_13570, partial [Rectinemataceae bacterium]|nr:hypothetical protein [Rectinemataceae bacterium]